MDVIASEETNVDHRADQSFGPVNVSFKSIIVTILGLWVRLDFQTFKAFEALRACSYCRVDESFTKSFQRKFQHYYMTKRGQTFRTFHFFETFRAFRAFMIVTTYQYYSFLVDKYSKLDKEDEVRDYNMTKRGQTFKTFHFFADFRAFGAFWIVTAYQY